MIMIMMVTMMIKTNEKDERKRRRRRRDKLSEGEEKDKEMRGKNIKNLNFRGELVFLNQARELNRSILTHCEK